MFHNATVKEIEDAFALVEKYDLYDYRGSDRVRVLTAITLDGGFDEPLIVRNFALTPFTDSTVTIKQYLAAKKAIHVKLNGDSIPVGIEVKRLADGTLTHRSSVYTLERYDGNTFILRDNEFQLPEEVLAPLVALLADTLGDREAFLQARVVVPDEDTADATDTPSEDDTRASEVA